MSLIEIGAVATTVGTAVTLAKVIWDAIKKSKPPKWLAPSVVLCVFFGLASIGLWVYDHVSVDGTPPPPPGPPVIQITYPPKGAQIPQEIVVEGYVTGELAEEQYLWLVVEWAGRWWPQYSSITPIYSPKTKRWEWNAPARIGEKEDVERPFNIVAVEVDSAINQRFQNWITEGERTKLFPGLPVYEVKQWGELKDHSRVSVIRNP